MNACEWQRESECAQGPYCCATLTHIHTQIRAQIHTLSTYTLWHINTLNWGNGYTVTHLAALWAKGCDEPWKNLLSPSHTHSLRQSQTDTGRGWIAHNSKHSLDPWGDWETHSYSNHYTLTCECRKKTKIDFFWSENKNPMCNIQVVEIMMMILCHWVRIKCRLKIRKYWIKTTSYVGF